ncbi:MAG: acetylglutamate kinase [Phycisphaerales bacterium]
MPDAPHPAPLVIKVGGAPLEDESIANLLAASIAALARRRAEARQGGVILIHGGGKAADRVLEALGFETIRRDGIRVTPPDQMPLIAGVLAGIVNKRLVGRLLGEGARAVGLCLGDAGAIQTRVTRRYPFNAGRVGDVVIPESPLPPNNLLHVLLREGFLPVVSSIGLDEQGEFLNINADDAAAGLARAIGAREVILMSDVPGVLDEKKRLIDALNPSRVAELIATGVIYGGMVPKVRAALEVAASAHATVVITSASDPLAIRALGEGQPTGTRLTAT